MARQACYLRTGDDSLDAATFHRTIGDALAEFECSARELDRYGQPLEASIHFVDARGDEPGEYPDRVLCLGPRGGLQVSHT